MTKKKDPFGDLAFEGDTKDNVSKEDVAKVIEELEEEDAQAKALSALSLLTGAMEAATPVLEKYIKVMPDFISKLEKANAVHFPKDFGEKLQALGQKFSTIFLESVESGIAKAVSEVKKNERRVSIPGYLFCVLSLLFIFLLFFTGLILGRYPMLFTLFWKGLAATLALTASVIVYHQYTIRYHRKHDGRRG